MIVEFWKSKEIVKLNKKIQSTEYSIKQFDSELVEIRKERQPSIKDFGMLVHKYGNKKDNEYLIYCCYRRIKLLKNNQISESEYRSMMFV